MNVVIEAWRTVWDLEFAPMDNSGAQPVPGQTVYRVHRMDPGQRLVVKVDFPGDMSAYHIALTDGGVRRNFAVSISGRDGLAVLDAPNLGPLSWPFPLLENCPLHPNPYST